MSYMRVFTYCIVSYPSLARLLIDSQNTTVSYESTELYAAAAVLVSRDLLVDDVAVVVVR